MSVERWTPNVKPTAEEARILARLKTQSMYRDTGAGAPPQPPALMCMALIVQGYTGDSDREVVELTVDSDRWQMVLGCLRSTEPAFS